MTFIKTISTKNTPANLTLKSAKALASPASAINADKVADLDLITGSNFAAPGASQKIINGAGLQDLGRADQIIGSIDRGTTSVMDQVGLREPSVMKPADAGTFYGLDPETVIGGQNKGDIIMGGASGARSQEKETKMTKEEFMELLDRIFKDAADKHPIFQPGTKTAAENLPDNWPKGDPKKNPNPEDDSTYGGTLKDPFGIVSEAQAKRLFPITKILDPAIDPNQESNTNGIYTGPSLGAVAGSNGGTSTGSWNSPYGFGGYSGPSIDAFASSNGGTSTGTFDPLF